MKKIMVEDLRETPIGEIVLLYQSHQVTMLSAFYADLAFKSTVQSLMCFENPTSSESIQKRRQNNYIAVAYWFLSLESYIMTFAKLLSLKQNTSIKRYKSSNLGGRINSVLNAMGLEEYRTQYSAFISKTNEFATFRNDLFHDRTLQNKRIYPKTYFSEIAYNLNIVDVIQAMDVAVEGFRLLSKTISGLNLMPQICVNLHWTTAERLLEDLNTVFIQIINKHQLDTRYKLNLEINKYESNVFQKNEVVAVIKAIDDKNYVFNQNITDCFSDMWKRYPYDNNSLTFPIPQYMT